MTRRRPRRRGRPPGPQPPRTGFGAQLCEARRSAGLSQRDLGALLGCGHELLGLVERGGAEGLRAKPDLMLLAQRFVERSRELTFQIDVHRAAAQARDQQIVWLLTGRFWE